MKIMTMPLKYVLCSISKPQNPFFFWDVAHQHFGESFLKPVVDKINENIDD